MYEIPAPSSVQASLARGVWWVCIQRRSETDIIFEPEKEVFVAEFSEFTSFIVDPTAVTMAV